MKKLALLALSLVLLITVTGCGKEKEEGFAINDEKSTYYEIVKKGEMSIAGAKRYAWDVIVKEEMNIQELEELSEEIVGEAKKETPFNAIVIGFYDYEEYVGMGHTLGRVEYAPKGDWAKAGTVKTGDYKNMDFEYSLMEKDWDKQLTIEEVDIFKAWKDLYRTKDTDPEDMDKYEDEVSEEIAEEFNKTSEEVNDILMKQTIWTFDNNK